MKKGFKLLTFAFLALISVSNLFCEHHAIFDAIEKASYSKVLLVLEREPESVNFVDENGVSPLFKLCDLYGSEEDFDRRKKLKNIFRYIVKYTDVNVNSVLETAPKFSILQYAIDKDISYSLIELLVKKGADISYVNLSGNSVLDIAEKNYLKEKVVLDALRKEINSHKNKIKKIRDMECSKYCGYSLEDLIQQREKHQFHLEEHLSFPFDCQRKIVHDLLKMMNLFHYLNPKFIKMEGYL
ncbi:TPA: hypothetical protein DEO28_03180 [Candidatus Dependentiae bacterium]|nr:MAG: hypothetical protein UR14_C0005G0015 [candidate division TM6 bacterium GW2011_GWE2_31_21]KKP53091.1 MAG: hypothetical protein UR43_C0007G0015 [candidate division TM6 bacterium GW2011_GWF2_33_332]HBS47909.1 hypothetical protein [Candidatus Dependentiae bacterium]HBZ73487.1 hypothetical protein [Candidatus Dependentiae bacterium]